MAIGLSRIAEERRGRYDELHFWGVIHVETGRVLSDHSSSDPEELLSQDYYILKTDVYRFGKDGLYERHDHYLPSQDGIKWFLLPAVDAKASAYALALTSLFSGQSCVT